jgi:anti-anti-sigma regulatory factor
MLYMTENAPIGATTEKGPRRIPPKFDCRPYAGAKMVDASSPSDENSGWTSTDARICDGGMEPELEISVDEGSSPVIIRMAGMLDSSTRRSLLSLLDQLLAEDMHSFILDAGDLAIGDASGADALAQFQWRTLESGGSLFWKGVDFGHDPFGDI